MIVFFPEEIGTNILDVNANLNSIDQNNGDLNDASNLNQSLQALNILAEVKLIDFSNRKSLRFKYICFIFFNFSIWQRR